MITYFQAASSDRALASRPTSTTLASVLPSMRTNSRPRLPVSSEASMRLANNAEEHEVQPDLQDAEDPGVFLGAQVGRRAE